MWYNSAKAALYIAASAPLSSTISRKAGTPAVTLMKLAKNSLPRPLIQIVREFRTWVRMRRIGIRNLSKMRDGAISYLGTTYGGYAVPTNLLKGSTGLSFGAGEDISFETAIAKELAATVHIYDPTPRAIEHCRRIVDEFERKNRGIIRNT